MFTPTGQILTFPTVALNVRAWIEGRAEKIGDSTARTIASWYHSPSPRDENITRLSHGLPFEPIGLVSEIDRTLEEMGEFDDLNALRHWAANLITEEN